MYSELLRVWFDFTFHKLTQITQTLRVLNCCKTEHSQPWKSHGWDECFLCFLISLRVKFLIAAWIEGSTAFSHTAAQKFPSALLIQILSCAGININSPCTSVLCGLQSVIRFHLKTATFRLCASLFPPLSLIRLFSSWAAWFCLSD